jgi:hypothetical protein
LFWKVVLWRQFAAAIDMLADALRQCPDRLWNFSMWSEEASPPGLSQFWYVAYHALFWLDLYLTGSVESFSPPAPFTLSELDPRGLLPEREYTKAELLAYLEHSRQKCRAVIEGLTDEEAQRICIFSWGEVSFAELLLDNMRHVQEHGAQLHMALGQQNGSNSRWMASLKDRD